MPCQRRERRSQPRDAVIVGYVRTPIGRHGGALAKLRPDSMAGQAIAALVERTGIDAASVDDVILGCANQAGEDNRNVARMALLLAGCPSTSPARRSTACAAPACRPSTPPPRRSGAARATCSSPAASRA